MIHSSKPAPLMLLTTATLALLTACGGGGGSDPSGAFAVTASRSSGGSTSVYTVCVEGIAYYDPATTQGQTLTRNLMQYYGMSGASQSLADSAKTCRQLVPAVNTIVSIDDYNRVVLPAINTSGPPTTAGTGGTGGTGSTGGTGETGNTGIPQGPGALTFIAWTGSANGVVVVDVDNEHFAFSTITRCMYSYNRQQSTSNFCLDPYPAATGYLAGLRFQVLSVTGSGGGCITALADLGGHQIDIFTDAAGVQTARALSSSWNTAGCTR
jgi:hypothetical protein